MAFCLTKDSVDEFLKRLREGEIDPEELARKTSSERRAYFASFMGEDNAKQVNALFESKMLLKNKKQGYISWAQKTAGLKETAKRDIISRIGKFDERILNPETEAQMLSDLAEHKLGIAVTEEEMKNISGMSKEVEKWREVAADGEEERIKYGEAVIKMQDYLDEINPNRPNFALNVLGLTRSVKVIGDLGVPFRQGWGMMSRSEWFKAFGAMHKYLVSKKAYDTLRADLVSNPLYPQMKTAKLRLSGVAGDTLSKREEDYMTTLLGKLPFVRGIERANVGFLTKLRADVFETLYNAALLRGENVKDPEVLRELGSVVNNFTGSGNIGKGDRYANITPILSNTFFSARKISATINMLNPKAYVTGSPTARKAATRQLLGSLLITSTVLGLASAAGADIELDPTSANFGKVTIGKHHIDITGGNGTYAVLLARLIAGKTKSSVSGKVYNLGEGYKPPTRGSLIAKFVTNKLAPIASEVVRLLTAQKSKDGNLTDEFGNEINVKNESYRLFVPMLIDNIIENARDDSDPLQVEILSILADYYGNSSMLY